MIQNIEKPKKFNPLHYYINQQSRKIKTGSDAIKILLEGLNLEQEIQTSRLVLSLKESGKDKNLLNNFTKREKQQYTREKLIRRIRTFENFLSTGSKPKWIILDLIPVIPPGLRPMIQLAGGRFATSDLNELYRRIILRNNRLTRLKELYAPEIIVNNEKRMLQEAVDTLIDNGKSGRKVIGSNNRPLKSLANIIEGKQGRFRQNLLGKRVDYSGRSVIIVGPSLKLHQCGLPTEMAIELFQPYLIYELLKNELVNNMREARTIIKQQNFIIWPILKKVIKKYPIFLNRAPTLHRLGIQTFEPILVQERAIKLHPLVCSAFNADFDGDQMAVHIPLSVISQCEANMLLRSSKNFLSPAISDAILVPSQDMVLGSFYSTLKLFKTKTKFLQYFSDSNDVIYAYKLGKVKLHTLIFVKENSNKKANTPKYLFTTVGRVLMNKIIKNNLDL